MADNGIHETAQWYADTKPLEVLQGQLAQQRGNEYWETLLTEAIKISEGE